MVVLKRKKGRVNRKRHKIPELQALQEAWMVSGKISVKSQGCCNILLIVPHGFPGDDTNAEMLGYHLAECLQCYAVINNRKYMKQTNSGQLSGFVADLFLQRDATTLAVNDYLNPIRAIVESIHETFSKPPLVLFLGGMTGTPSLNPPPPFCAVQVDTDIIKLHCRGVTTVPERMIEEICNELEKVGFVPWKKGSGIDDSMLTYFTKNMNWPVSVARLGVPFSGFRDNVAGLDEGAKLLAEAVKKMSAYEELEPGQFRSAFDKSLTTLVRPSTDHELEEQVDEELIEAAVIFINETLNKTIYKGAEEIGAYVLEKFFDNDVDEASSRAPQKSISYRRLCERDDLLLSPGQLSVMVRVAAQESYFSKNRVDVTALSYTHKAELVKLQNSQAKLDLVKEAIEGAYSTRRLEERVKEIRKQALGSDGIGVSEIARYVHNPLKLFEDPVIMKFVGDSAKLKKLPPDFRDKLHADAFNMIERINEWRRKYGRLVRKLEKIAEKENRAKAEESTELLRRPNS